MLLADIVNALTHSAFKLRQTRFDLRAITAVTSEYLFARIVTLVTFCSSLMSMRTAFLMLCHFRMLG